MPILSDYSQFDGRHWETGSVANVLAYQRLGAEQALPESMLLGLSGGAAFAYFVFDYKDSDPHLALLPRNTFDPFETLMARLALPQDLYQTAKPDKAEANLIEILEGGRPAIVWADIFELPYNTLPPDEQMWAMNPIVVYGYQDGVVHIADRSSQPLTVSSETLARARARVKKDRFRVLALGEPNLQRLPDAITAAIRQCISLYTEKPPRGSGDNFGISGYEKWVSLLTSNRNKSGWARLLPPGRRMYSALAGFSYQPGGFGWSRAYPSNQVDDKAMYAEFLTQSADILSRPGLTQAAERFREASVAWRDLSDALLPHDVPLLDETRQLLLTRRDLFIREGQSALGQIEGINQRLVELLRASEDDFPLTEQSAVELRARIAEGVKVVSGIEQDAVRILSEAVE